MKDINALRKEIDQIDKAILTLFEARMLVIKEVAAYKSNLNKPLRDVKREQELIQNKIQLLEHEEHAVYVEKLFKEIMTSSLDYQKQLLKSKK